MNSEELQLLPVAAENGSAIPIAYRFREPEDMKPVFVWFCGFKSEMGSIKAEALSAWAKANGAGCLRFDYSGHGQSGGNFVEGTISDWTGQAAAVCARVLGARPTVFVGSSMGGWIALLLARQEAQGRAGVPAAQSDGGVSEHLERSTPRINLKGLALIAPAWDMTRFMWNRASNEARAAVARDGVYYRPSDYGDEPYAITKTLIDDGENHLFGKGPIPLTLPIRIIHGCQDPDVPWKHSLELLDVLDSPDIRLTLVKDAEHRLSRPQDLALLFSMLSEFL